MKSEHTPGPWSFRRAKFPVDGEFDFGIFAVVDGNTVCISEAFGRVAQASFPDAEANARLIAAAPDLLAALQLILSLAKGYAPAEQTATARRTCGGWIEAAECAVAKAEGK